MGETLDEKARRAAEENEAHWPECYVSATGEGCDCGYSGRVDILAAAFKAFAEEARREAIDDCAKACEDHEWHMDFAAEQNHTDRPKRCCVADAVRALARPTQGEKRAQEAKP